ncbi:hypothetical protein ES288_A10G153900v1 [Gossypium darwinii]|nr:hypothetical protein ES288_A10G153900v1 [Gossypium darwinii]
MSCPNLLDVTFYIHRSVSIGRDEQPRASKDGHFGRRIPSTPISTKSMEPLALSRGTGRVLALGVRGAYGAIDVEARAALGLRRWHRTEALSGCCCNVSQGC